MILAFPGLKVQKKKKIWWKEQSGQLTVETMGVADLSEGRQVQVQDASTAIAADRPRRGPQREGGKAAGLETPVWVKSFFQLEENHINGKHRVEWLSFTDCPCPLRRGQQVALVGCSQPSQLPPQVGAER